MADFSEEFSTFDLNLVPIVKVKKAIMTNNKKLNQNKKIRNLKQEFSQVATYFDKDIWFVNKGNSLQLKYLHSQEAIIDELFFYFDLKQ